MNRTWIIGMGAGVVAMVAWNACAQGGTRVAPSQPAAVRPVRVAAAAPVVAFDEDAPASPVMEFLHNYIEVGTRLTIMNLSEPTRPADPRQEETFIGHLNRMDEEQDYSPFKLFADFVVNPYFVVELTYDKIEARVYNSDVADAPNASDGTVCMSGPILTVQGRYPIQERFVPYAGLGLAFLQADFSESGWWAQGWKTPEDYEAAGGGPSPTGYTRVMNVDGDVAPVLVAGFIYYITPNWAAEFMLRYMDATADAHFVRYNELGAPDLERFGAFEFEHVATGLGGRYSF